VVPCSGSRGRILFPIRYQVKSGRNDFDVSKVRVPRLLKAGFPLV
ncbi:MAG: hypothetical protein, partial [Olavius algarvensis Gamma 1 endosymbiont]